MLKQPFGQVEPPQPRLSEIGRSDKRLRKADVDDLLGGGNIVLASAVARIVLDVIEFKERRKLRRLLLIIASGLIILIGFVRLALMQLHWG
jgi:hypothetical protein